MKNFLILATIYACFFSCTSAPADQNTESAQDSTNIVERPANDTSEEASESIIELIIHENAFLGISPGDPVSKHQSKTRKSVIENGEGSFDVYLILDEDGNELGFFDALLIDEEEEVGLITVTTEEARTAEGVRVGMTYSELARLLDDFTVYGSEIEGRVHVDYGNYYFLIDHRSWEVDLPKEEIPGDSKVQQIIISRKQLMANWDEEEAVAAATTGYYICYESDSGAAKDLAVHLTDEGEARSLRYQGQSETIYLQLLSRESSSTAYSTDVERYREIIDGQAHGTYEFTKSGNWYYAKYIPEGSAKEFTFTYSPDKGFSESPCF